MPLPDSTSGRRRSSTVAISSRVDTPQRAGTVARAFGVYLVRGGDPDAVRAAATVCIPRDYLTRFQLDPIDNLTAAGVALLPFSNRQLGWIARAGVERCRDYPDAPLRASPIDFRGPFKSPRFEFLAFSSSEIQTREVSRTRKDAPLLHKRRTVRQLDALYVLTGAQPAALGMRGDSVALRHSARRADRRPRSAAASK
jgi:hypothetical protein